MDTLKKIISTPIMLIPSIILGYGFFVGKVNGILALLIIGLMLVFVLTNSGHKQLWK